MSGEVNEESNLRKLAGTTGLEPATSCVTVPRWITARNRSSSVTPSIHEPLKHVARPPRVSCRHQHIRAYEGGYVTIHVTKRYGRVCSTLRSRDEVCAG